jgi:hypothetical protein
VLHSQGQQRRFGPVLTMSGLPLEEMQNQYIEHRVRLERQVLRFLRPEADSDEDV